MGMVVHHSPIHLGYGSTATAVPHTYGTDVMSCEGRLSSRVSDNGYPSLYVFFESKLQQNTQMISAEKLESIGLTSFI